MKTIRRLHGISYWGMQDPDEIRDFIKTNVRKEWKADAKSEGLNASKDPWLQILPRRTWTLEVVRGG